MINAPNPSTICATRCDPPRLRALALALERRCVAVELSSESPGGPVIPTGGRAGDMRSITLHPLLLESELQQGDKANDHEDHHGDRRCEALVVVDESFSVKEVDK